MGGDPGEAVQEEGRDDPREVSRGHNRGLGRVAELGRHAHS